MNTKDLKLSRILKEYQQGRLSRENLEGALFTHIRENPDKFSPFKFKKDSWHDFISWLYPRLHRAVDQYTDRGSSFDAYIVATVQQTAKEYGLRKREHRIIEKLWWNTKATEAAAVAEAEEPAYLEDVPIAVKVPNRRQALMLLLKSYYQLSDLHLEKLAPSLGVRKEELYRMVDELRVLRLNREEIINTLKERIHSQFYRCLSFEKRMKTAARSSAHWHKMKRCLENARKRLASMRKRLQTVRMGASNREIARVMKVSKGTVDSNLYAVRLKNQTDSQ
jgi:DNA-directed RNA polymerase specialized sigma24 family protein